MDLKDQSGAVDSERHRVRRVRHEGARRRELVVTRVLDLTPKMRRVVFRCANFEGFASASPDDHLKLFVPGDGERVMRDYTPRAFDPAAKTITIDFALHDAGPATAWAMAARPGDIVEIGGPRGSVIPPQDFDWYLLAGDETALPAISRWLGEMPSGTRVFVVVLVDGLREEQHLRTSANCTTIWLHRRRGADEAVQLKAAISALYPQTGQGFVWVAAEAAIAKNIRDHLVTAHNHPPMWMKAAGYWVRGHAGTSDKGLESA